MQVVECNHCLNRRSCPLLVNHCRQIASAILDGKDADDCPQFRPEYRHGVDGVYRVGKPVSLMRE